MKNVIAGGGLAAVRAAEAMRTAGFDGENVILGAEPHLPYSRPELSKGFLRGESNRGALFLQTQAFYDEWKIDVRPGRRVAATKTSQVNEVSVDAGNFGDICAGAAVVNAMVLNSATPEAAKANAAALPRP